MSIIVKLKSVRILILVNSKYLFDFSDLLNLIKYY